MRARYTDTVFQTWCRHWSHVVVSAYIYPTVYYIFQRFNSDCVLQTYMNKIRVLERFTNHDRGDHCDERPCNLLKIKIKIGTRKYTLYSYTCKLLTADCIKIDPEQWKHIESRRVRVWARPTIVYLPIGQVIYIIYTRTPSVHSCRKASK